MQLIWDVLVWVTGGGGGIIDSDWFTNLLECVYKLSSLFVFTLCVCMAAFQFMSGHFFSTSMGHHMGTAGVEGVFPSLQAMYHYKTRRKLSVLFFLLSSPTASVSESMLYIHLVCVCTFSVCLSTL